MKTCSLLTVLLTLVGCSVQGVEGPSEPAVGGKSDHACGNQYTFKAYQPGGFYPTADHASHDPNQPDGWNHYFFPEEGIDYELSHVGDATRDNPLHLLVLQGNQHYRLHAFMENGQVQINAWAGDAWNSPGGYWWDYTANRGNVFRGQNNAYLPIFAWYNGVVEQTFSLTSTNCKPYSECQYNSDCWGDDFEYVLTRSCDITIDDAGHRIGTCVDNPPGPECTWDYDCRHYNTDDQEYICVNNTCAPKPECELDVWCQVMVGNDYICVEGTCERDPNCVENGTCDPVCDDGFDLYRGECVPACAEDEVRLLNGECTPRCSEGYVYRDGACHSTNECSDDNPCPDHFSCQDGVCVDGREYAPFFHIGLERTYLDCNPIREDGSWDPACDQTVWLFIFHTEDGGLRGQLMVNHYQLGKLARVADLSEADFRSAYAVLGDLENLKHYQNTECDANFTPSYSEVLSISSGEYGTDREVQGCTDEKFSQVRMILYSLRNQYLPYYESGAAAQ